MTFSAKIAMRSTAPPDSMLNMPSKPWVCCSMMRGELIGIDAGERDVRAEAIDDERAEREPDAPLQLFGLGEAPTN